MKEYQRSQRVAPLIQAVVAKMLQTEIEDPLFKTVSVTAVEVSRDLSFAKIYITTHRDEKAQEVVKQLNEYKKEFRHRIAQEVILRKVPDIRFYYDESVARSARIAELLNKIP
ncbi:MAG: 30S ribosome-binding factor RbfA [Gammaproteobacteria bacterium]|nr:30S ribosome-binding factor RbfA [Gammaproteobacteria bacterium]